jgi:hypothetical protein
LFITIIPIEYDTQIIIFGWVYKPTNLSGEHHPVPSWAASTVRAPMVNTISDTDNTTRFGLPNYLVMTRCHNYFAG